MKGKFGDPCEVVTVVICGFAGAGKPWLGKLIAQRLSYTYLDKDSLSRGFVEGLLSLSGHSPNDRESDFYSKVCNPLEYAQLAAVSKENVMLGNSTVLSAPCIRQLEDFSWFDCELRCDVPGGHRVKVVWLDSTRESERVRMLDRGAARDAWKLQNWDEYCRSVENVDRSLPVGVCRFNRDDDSEFSFNERVDALVQWIQF